MRSTLCLLLALSCALHAGDDSATLDFTSNPTAVPNPARTSQSVTFTAAVSNPEKKTLTYSWDFGDGSTAAGPIGTHAYVAAGSYTVSVSVTDGTLTNSAQVLVTVSRIAALVGEGPDTDRDGFSDSFESATELNPQDILSTPLNGARAVANLIQPLNLSKANIALNFAGARPDSILVSGTIPLTEGMALSGQKMYLDVGGVSRVLTLDANGSASQNGGSLKLSASKKSRSPRAESDSANYSIQFKSTWSNATHPHPNFPSSAHYSSLIGAVHNAQSTFWAPGALASKGIEQMAENGSTGGLKNEFSAAGANVLATLEGGALGVTPGQISIPNFTVTRDHPLVTLVTMIAPTPDWFVGVSGLSLLDEAGNWRDELEVTLYPWDSGSDDGPDYISSDIEPTPHQPIFSLKGVAPFSSEPLGTFKFTRKGSAPTPGTPTPGTTADAKFTLKLSGEDFETAFTDEGLTAEKDFKKSPRTVAISVVLNNTIYKKTQPLIYTTRKSTGVATTPK